MLFGLSESMRSDASILASFCSDCICEERAHSGFSLRGADVFSGVGFSIGREKEDYCIQSGMFFFFGGTSSRVFAFDTFVFFLSLSVTFCSIRLLFTFFHDFFFGKSTSLSSIIASLSEAEGISLSPFQGDSTTPCVSISASFIGGGVHFFSVAALRSHSGSSSVASWVSVIDDDATGVILSFSISVDTFSFFSHRCDASFSWDTISASLIVSGEALSQDTWVCVSEFHGTILSH